MTEFLRVFGSHGTRHKGSTRDRIYPWCFQGHIIAPTRQTPLALANRRLRKTTPLLWLAKANVCHPEWEREVGGGRREAQHLYRTMTVPSHCLFHAWKRDKGGAGLTMVSVCKFASMFSWPFFRCRVRHATRKFLLLTFPVWRPRAVIQFLRQ